MRTKAYITIAIRLRYDDNTTHSATTEVIEIAIRLRPDYDVFDSTAIRLRYDYDEKLTFIFCSRRIALNGSRRTRYVVVGS